jgi:hypothetical protein
VEPIAGYRSLSLLRSVADAGASRRVLSGRWTGPSCSNRAIETPRNPEIVPTLLKRRGRARADGKLLGPSLGATLTEANPSAPDSERQPRARAVAD